MYNQPLTMGMGRSRYVARHNTSVLEWVGETSSDIDHTLKLGESIYVKRNVENPKEILGSVKHMLGQDAILRSSGLLHVSVLQPDVAHRLHVYNKTLRGLVNSAKKSCPQLSRPVAVSFDRLVQYPSKDGEKTLYSLGYDRNSTTALDLETEAAIKSIGGVCGYQGAFSYIHDPHITIAMEDKSPPKYQETMLELPVTAHLAKATFFVQKLA